MPNDGDGVTPWAYVTHKDGYWAGVAAVTLPKTALQKFLGSFAADGFTITTVKSRAEYNHLLDSLKYWHDEGNPHAKRRPKKGALL